ncbi:unnamed protein product [Rhizophagus irregularis]|nr:unnamed protein product [Rhizophagus irregularis]
MLSFLFFKFFGFFWFCGQGSLALFGSVVIGQGSSAFSGSSALFSSAVKVLRLFFGSSALSVLRSRFFGSDGYYQVHTMVAMRY